MSLVVEVTRNPATVRTQTQTSQPESDISSGVGSTNVVRNTDHFLESSNNNDNELNLTAFELMKIRLENGRKKKNKVGWIA